jgi:hypothetical protein
MPEEKPIPRLFQRLVGLPTCNLPRAMNKSIAFVMTLLLVALTASCSSAVETDVPVSVSPTVPQKTPTSDSMSEATPWVFTDGWWREPRVWAVQPGAEWDDTSVIEAFDFPEYEATNVSVVSWFEGSRVVIDELHSRGYTVVGQDGMIWMYQPDRTAPDLFWDESAGIFNFKMDDPPELAEAALTDPFGNPIFAEMFGFSDGIQYLQYSVPHPAWQEYMTEHMKNLIDAGVDGYLIDELAYGTVFYPDFNAHMLQEFNRFLEQQFEPSDLQVLLESVGVDDLASFDYAAIVREHLPTDMTALPMEDWKGDLPLFKLYSRFLALENYEAAAALIKSGREYAAETAGKEIPFSANINTLSSPNAFLIIPLLDMIDLEFFYADLGYFRNARGVAPLKLTRYFDKPAIMRTSVSAEPDLAEWGSEGTVDLFGTMIADAVSSGGTFYVEGSVEQDIAALVPYYRFRSDHSDLFEDLKPLDPQVAVLLLWENVVADPFQISAYFGASSLLADSGVQFDAVFGAEEYLRWGELPMYPAPDFPLDLENLRNYPLIVIPEMNDLIESHAEMLMEYVNLGGVLVTYIVDEFGLEFQHEDDPSVTALLKLLRSGTENEAGGKVIRLDQNLARDYRDNPDPTLRQKWLNVMSKLGLSPEVRYDPGLMVAAQVYSTENQLVVHFVNYNWDISTLSTPPVSEFDVEIVLPDNFDRAGLTVSLHAPGEDAMDLDVEATEAGIIVTIPELHIWSVISITTGR